MVFLRGILPGRLSVLLPGMRKSQVLVYTIYNFKHFEFIFLLQRNAKLDFVNRFPFPLVALREAGQHGLRDEGSRRAAT